MPKLQGKERILCAAIYYDDAKQYVHSCKNLATGYILCGWRHHNIINLNFNVIKSKIIGIQGFLTSYNRFLDRREAAKLAYEVGQIPEKKEFLFSEDLY